MTQAPEQFMVDLPRPNLIAGPAQFIEISNIYTVPDINFFTLDCDTSQPCRLALHWRRTQPPADPGQQYIEGIVEDVGESCHHVFETPPISNPVPHRLELAQEIRYYLRLSQDDDSERDLRPYVGTVKLRQVPWNFVPVRFFNYGGTPPPPPGGDEGDWNTYAWAQYNPNGHVFGHAPYEFLDLLGTNGHEVIPVARVIARYAVGADIAVSLQAPIPNAAHGVTETPDLYQTAVLDVYVQGTLRERFCWKVNQPGELEPVERLIRATAESQRIRIARLVVNPGPTPTFMGPNYWLQSMSQTNLQAPP